MKIGTRVARVSLRSDEGTIGDFGTIRSVYTDEAGATVGYYVEWDATPKTPARMGYVQPVRLTTLAEYERDRRDRNAAA